MSFLDLGSWLLLLSYMYLLFYCKLQKLTPVPVCKINFTCLVQLLSVFTLEYCYLSEFALILLSVIALVLLHVCVYSLMFPGWVHPCTVRCLCLLSLCYLFMFTLVQFHDCVLYCTVCHMSVFVFALLLICAQFLLC